MIDERTSIHPSAKLADNVEIGPWTVIGENVEIGSGSQIGANVSIEKNTRLGKNNRVFSFASLGSDPQHIGYRGEETWLEMGDNNVVREFVTINRGTLEGSAVTRVGSHNYFMSCSHVAHDCVVGDHIVFANTASIAGYVEVGDHAILGAFSGVHQFVRIGAYSFLGRATKIYQDILPFMLVTGNPGAPNALNSVGLKRNNFSSQARETLKEAYRIIFRSGLMQQDICHQLESLTRQCKEVGQLLEAIQSSTRGIARHSD